MISFKSEFRGYTLTLTTGNRLHSIRFNKYNRYSPLFLIRRGEGYYMPRERMINIWIICLNIIIQWNIPNIAWDTVRIDGVDSGDYPKFCDAYYEYAEYVDGTPLSDSELGFLTDSAGEHLNTLAMEHVMCE